VKNDTEVFLRQLVTGSIRDEEHLEEARKQLKRINRIRADIDRSDAPDKDQKGSSLDRWHELLRRRMAEKRGRGPRRHPDQIDKGRRLQDYAG
jgi:hypothetical protein